MLFHLLEPSVDYQACLANNELWKLRVAIQIFAESNNTSFDIASATLPIKQTALTQITYSPHIIYAYLIETTGIAEIFRGLLFNMLTSERHGNPNDCMKKWMLFTEETFFSNIRTVPFASACSEIRPSFKASRWNIYQRMLGNTFNHDRSFTFPAPDTANTALLSKSLELLLEIRSGLRFQTVTGVPNTTDYTKIRELAALIADMLTARRSFLDVSRIERLSCALLGWLHFSLYWRQSPIVGHFKLGNLPIEDRLASLARDVGLACHQQSRAYFLVAASAEKLFAWIEANRNGNIFDPTSNKYLAPAALNEAEMSSLISNWELICQRPPSRS